MFGKATNPRYQEILKLDRMLTEANIPHTLARLFDGWQICYPGAKVGNTSCVMDAIEHFGSYGHEDDKLEIMGLLTPEEKECDSVLGYLTAEDVFKRIKKHFDGERDPEHADDSDYEQKEDRPVSPAEFAAEMRRIYDACRDNEEDCT